MTAPKTLVVWAHPRPDSLTATVADDVADELRMAGAETEVLDLYRLPFDPILREPDEPDWGDLDKRYSPEVQAEIERFRDVGTVVFVFPVWWYSLPATMKGYIERVWNHGVFYGGGRGSDLQSVLWVGLAGETRKQFEERGYTEMMERSLNLSIADYCGVPKSRLELLFNTLGDGIDDMGAHVAELRTIARSAARAAITT